MPCLDPGGDAHYAHEVQQRLNKVTRLLCGLCNALTEARLDDEFIAENQELAAWWAEHQQADAARLARELREQEKQDLRRAALAKLTEEERLALNLREENK